MEELEVETLAAIAGVDGPAILDVREAWEFDLCRVPGSQHIPLGDLPARLHEIARDRPLVVVCHHGVRSRAAQVFLLRQGFTRVQNLVGGLDAWARRVDPTMAIY